LTRAAWRWSADAGASLSQRRFNEGSEKDGGGGDRGKSAARDIDKRLVGAGADAKSIQRTLKERKEGKEKANEMKDVLVRTLARKDLWPNWGGQRGHGHVVWGGEMLRDQ